MPTLIKDRYEVLETLGAGGEARVVKAIDTQHDRFVALKIRHVHDDDRREELLGEARILLAVPPHAALPLVREDFFYGDDYVVAMDWVDGTDLAVLLRDRGRPGLAPSSVLAYLAEAAEALTHLHAQDPPVIHGDVKPANLILTKGGRVKLVDFGVSSAPGMLRRRTGTPGFRAPELAAGGAPSRASDVYSLAATAFALLTGAPPAGVLPAWQGIDPKQAQQLEAAIRLGLATDPAQRPATPGEFVERLRAGWGAALPTGVVTMCLSDIEGSTAMWDADPESMAEALVRHDAIIADCMAAHGGRLIKSMGEGDSTVSVFDAAPPALEAAVEATRALAAEQWPGDLRIVVRFGIHTGEVERRGADYFGPTVNLAARLRGQADGGQIFLSAVTAELVSTRLPDGCELVDLGPHRLKGLAQPERVKAVKGPGLRAPLPVTDCPYRGLLAFLPEDREFFFGREEVVAELVARLAPGQLLAIVGASGSGKSSVLRAGVVAAVQAGEVRDIARALVLTPGARPDLDLPDEPGTLVVVDQFEELFTLCDDPERRRAFIDALLARSGPVAIGVRADFYGRLGDHPGLAIAVAGNQVLLGPMSDEELQRAVTEPARLAGLRIEAGLVDLVLRDVAGEPGALPLLSHALRATWERRDGRTLTVDGYRESGGVASALAQTADTVIAELPEDRRALTRNVFLRLTELGDAVEDSRRRVPIDDLVPEGASLDQIQALLERLSDARLVTLGEDTAEVAHEVLIREWPTLRGWLDEDREGIRLHRQLGDAAHLWHTGGRETSDLYRGARLGIAEDWALAHRDDLNAGERAFLDASVAEAGRERRTQLRANRRLRALLGVAAVLLVAAIVAGVLSSVQRNNARHAERDAEAQALTSDAERVGAEAIAAPDIDRALLLGVASRQLQDRVETRGDLLATLERSPAVIALLRPSQTQATGLAVDPSGTLLASGDDAGVVSFVDLRTRAPRGKPVRLGAAVAPRAITFSTDGRTLAVGARQGDRTYLYLVDVGSHASRRVATWNGLVPPPQVATISLAYSPGGEQIAAGFADTSTSSLTPTSEHLYMLDATTGHTIWRRPYPMRGGQGEAHVQFTTDGALVTSAEQGDTYIWNAGTGRVVRRFSGGGVLALSSDGRTAAIARNSPDPTNPSAGVALLDLRTGHERRLASELPSAWIESIAITPDGQSVVGGAFDGAHVWSVATGGISDNFAGQGIARATLDPTGRTVLVGSIDGTVTMYDLRGTRRLGRAFRWGGPALTCPFAPCLAVNHASNLMATDQSDGTVALVDLRTLKLTHTLPAVNGALANAIAFAADGKTLITGGINGSVTLWDPAAPKIVRTLRFAGPVWQAAESPDGTLLAVQTQAQGSPDSRVEVRSLATGKTLYTRPVQYGQTGIEFSSDGSKLAAVGCCQPSSIVVVWDARSGRQLFARRFAGHATAIAFTHDAHQLAVGTTGGVVLLWDAASGRQQGAPIPVAAGGVNQVTFSPDGRVFAISDNDGTVSLWDLASRRRIGRPLLATTMDIPIVGYEPNGRVLIVELSNATEWPTDPRAWAEYACGVAGRPLTPQEWRDLLPHRPVQRVCSM